MSGLASSLNQIIERLLLPKGKTGVLVQQLILLALAVAFVCRQGPLESAALAIAGLLAGALVLAPPRLATATFLLFVGFSHQYRSLFVLRAGGVEWHPRELLLFLLLLCVLVNFARGRAAIVFDPMHTYVVLAGVYFMLVAVVGLLSQNDLHRVVAEARAPFFLASYVAFVSLSRPADLFFYRRLFTVALLAVAVTSLGFFAYTAASGHLLANVQNNLGEFVQHRVGPLLLQSVRPSGHMYFEVGLAVFVSLASCRDIPARKRILYLACAGVLSAAVLITIMRTAYVSVAVSLLLLAYLSLPTARQRATAAVAGGLLGALAIAGCFTVFREAITEAMPQIGVSLQARLVEMRGALRIFEEHPLVGAGMGSTFSALGLATKSSQFAYAESTFQTIHNVWMYFLFKGGVLGFVIIFIGLAGILFELVRRIPRIAGPHEQAIFRGLTAAYGAQLVATLAMPRLLYPKGYVYLAMMAAYAVLATGVRPPSAPASPDEHVRS